MKRETVTVNDDKHQSPVFIDRDALALALADVRKARTDEADQIAAVAVLRGRVEELDAEVARVETALMATPDATMSLEQIKAFANEQLGHRFELDALHCVRDDLQRQVKALESDSLRFIYLQQDCRSAVWRRIYEGLLASIDKQMLSALIAAGFMIDKHPHSVLSEMNLEDLRDESIEKLIVQFGLSEV
jgi:cell division protein FtsB